MLEGIINSLLEESYLSSFKLSGDQRRSTNVLVIRFESTMADTGVSASLRSNSTPARHTVFRRKSPSQVRRDRNRQLQHQHQAVTSERISTSTTTAPLENVEFNDTMTPRRISCDSAIAIHSVCTLTSEQNSAIGPRSITHQALNGNAMCEHRDTQCNPRVIERNNGDDITNRNNQSRVSEKTVPNTPTEHNNISESGSRSITETNYTDTDCSESETEFLFDTPRDDPCKRLSPKPIDEGDMSMSTPTIAPPTSKLLNERMHDGSTHSSRSESNENSTHSSESEGESTNTKIDFKDKEPKREDALIDSSISTKVDLMEFIDHTRISSSTKRDGYYRLATTIAQPQRNNELRKLILDTGTHENTTVIRAETDDLVVEYCLTRKSIVDFTAKASRVRHARFHKMRMRQLQISQDQTERINRDHKEDIERIVSLLPLIKKMIHKQILRDSGLDTGE